MIHGSSAECSDARMSTDDALGKRGRAFEDDYFRRKDQELLEKMRQEAAAKKTQQALGATTGLTDPVLLQELQSLWIHAGDGVPAAARAGVAGGLGRGWRDFSMAGDNIFAIKTSVWISPR